MLPANRAVAMNIADKRRVNLGRLGRMAPPVAGPVPALPDGSAVLNVPCHPIEECRIWARRGRRIRLVRRGQRVPGGSLLGARVSGDILSPRRRDGTTKSQRRIGASEHRRRGFDRRRRAMASCSGCRATRRSLTAAWRPSSRPGVSTCPIGSGRRGSCSPSPAAIEAAHLAYYRAGAQVATTASYQASIEGFAAAGVDRAAGASAGRPERRARESGEGTLSRGGRRRPHAPRGGLGRPVRRDARRWIGVPRRLRPGRRRVERTSTARGSRRSSRPAPISSPSRRSRPSARPRSWSVCSTTSPRRPG